MYVKYFDQIHLLLSSSPLLLAVFYIHVIFFFFLGLDSAYERNCDRFLSESGLFYIT
jgi:hypothetical protein